MSWMCLTKLEYFELFQQFYLLNYFVFKYVFTNIKIYENKNVKKMLKLNVKIIKNIFSIYVMRLHFYYYN